MVEMTVCWAASLTPWAMIHTLLNSATAQKSISRTSTMARIMGGAFTGVAAKEAVLSHFQYTSDFPVASDRSVMGNEPKPPNSPMSMSNVSVTVTSSLS